MEQRGEKRAAILPVLTIIILIVIVGIAGVTRFTVKAYRLHESVYSKSQVSLYDDRQYIQKQQIINLIVNIPLQCNFKIKSNDTFSTYINGFNTYINNATLQIDGETYNKIEEKITELTDIMLIERECNFEKMSVDGKAVAIDIADQIYDFLGLNMTTNIRGDIEKIYADDGTAIFTSQEYPSNYNIQYPVLIITSSIMISLLLILYGIAKKKNLFQKEEEVHEFDEKRYA